jgi:hypothetical protein
VAGVNTIAGQFSQASTIDWGNLSNNLLGIVERGVVSAGVSTAITGGLR